eukprot:870140-Pelagomonas_calceolata.AAC.1
MEIRLRVETVPYAALLHGHDAAMQEPSVGMLRGVVIATFQGDSVSLEGLRINGSSQDDSIFVGSRNFTKVVVENCYVKIAHARRVEAVYGDVFLKVAADK